MECELYSIQPRKLNITAINCYNGIYENTFFKTNLLIKESQLRSIIRETIRRLLNA